MRYKHLITKLLDFGAGIYDPLFRLTVDGQKFRKKLLELAHLEGNEKVLVVACGTGTFDLMIAKILGEGSICGIDISPNMIEIAKSRAKWLRD
jgi:ubiquinone/menaquinone biosynthesis C-methylase UbiE